MRWFLDTEFAEDGETIKLISIALVSEAGEEFYSALLDGWADSDCSDWVKQNVLPSLPRPEEAWAWNGREQVADAVRHLLLSDGTPEIWGYFSDYDWVVFCQLFGTMMDLPEGFPMFCLDLKQEMHRLGVERESLPPNDAHDALVDARWIRNAWLQLRRVEAQR